MAQTDRSDARAARIAAWKVRAAALLATAAEADASAGARYVELAATLVGMFDAGARDAEVAAFLKRAAGDSSGLQHLSDDRLATLAAELHRAAAVPDPHVAT